LSPKEREFVMHCLLWTGALSLSLSLSVAAAAAVYRCPGADGVPSFQAVPCAGLDETPLELAPLNTLGDGVRPAERRWLQQRDRAAQADRPQRRAGSGDQERRQAERCLRERQRLTAVQAKLRRGYKPAQGERLRRRRDEHSQYLRRFCD
jgi:hypothetical protein